MVAKKGDGWHLAPSLIALEAEVDKRWPKRSRVSDGSIGDQAHAARSSEHNPDRDADGMPNGAVSAIDITATNNTLREAVLKAAIGSPRVWYVINRGSIWSRTHGWEKRDYDGSNPHTNHIHISLAQTKRAHDDTSSWGIAETEPVKPAATPDETIDGAVARPAPKAKVLPTLSRGDTGDYVAFLQRFLAVKPAIGQFGPRTARAVRRYQRSRGLTVDGVVGPNTWKEIAKGTKLPDYN
jgi:hypothetical protein